MLQREMELDAYAMVMLLKNPDAPKESEEVLAQVQDAHMAYLSSWHERGVIKAAGPVMDEELRGIVLMNTSVEEAELLMREDPAVRAGRFVLKVSEWLVPQDVLTFSHGHLPRSMREVQ